MNINWGWRIAIVYTFFAVSTVGFVAFAMTQNVELVRADYYEQSLRYDQTFAAEKRGLAVSEQLTTRVGADQLDLQLPISHTSIDSGTVSFYRPDNSKLDQLYRIHTPAVLLPLQNVVSGHYQLQIEWSYNGERYRVVRSIEVDHSGSGGVL